MKSIDRMRTIFLQTEYGLGKYFDLIIQILIIISLISFTLETLPDLPSLVYEVLYKIELIIVIIFSFEYVLRIILAEKKVRFIFSFYGLIDLLAILPFYVTAGVDLRSIRIFRLLRLLRTFKIFRYSKALQQFKEAFTSIKAELILFLFATSFLLYVASVGIYYFENEVQPEKFASIFHCLWWAVATLTTVGYGDIYPITAGGKIFTSIIVLIGIGIVAVPTGLIASAMTKVINKETEV